MVGPDAATPGVLPRLEYRPLRRSDFPLLHRWLNTPHVTAFWPREPPTPDDLERKYGPRVEGRGGVRVFLFEAAGRPLGLAQCFRWADRPQREFPVRPAGAASIDFLVGEPDALGGGLGSAAFGGFVDVVFGLYPDADVLVGYPHRDNAAFQRVLRKAGYRRLDEAHQELGIPLPANWGTDPHVVYVLPRATWAARRSG